MVAFALKKKALKWSCSGYLILKIHYSKSICKSDAFAKGEENDALGTDLSSDFSMQVRNKKACKQSCQNTDGCNFWVFASRSEPNRRLRRACYLMSAKAASAPNEHRVSGELNCRDNGNDNDYDDDNNNNNNNGGGGVIDNRCLTSSGGTVGAECVFPFNYQVKSFLFDFQSILTSIKVT